jgi:hypothetical protein
MEEGAGACVWEELDEGRGGERDSGSSEQRDEREVGGPKKKKENGRGFSRKGWLAAGGGVERQNAR